MKFFEITAECNGRLQEKKSVALARHLVYIELHSLYTYKGNCGKMVNAFTKFKVNRKLFKNSLVKWTWIQNTNCITKTSKGFEQ